MGTLEIIGVYGASAALVGAFIDFLLGKAGQIRVRGWLETWWIKFSDVRLGNFGREEALFVVQIMDQLFGPALFSVRRLLSTLGIGVVSTGLAMVIWIRQTSQQSPKFSFIDSMFVFSHAALFLLTLFLLALSLSLTRAIAKKSAAVCGTGAIRNLFLFFTILFIQYLLLVLWRPISSLLSYSVLVAIEFTATNRIDLPLLFHIASSNLSSTFKEHDWSPAAANPIFQLYLFTSQFRSGSATSNIFTWTTDWTTNFVGYVANIGRLLLAVAFVGSFLLTPLRAPISLMWARVVESEKPVFTLVFGGTAALLKAIEEAAKRL